MQAKGAFSPRESNHYDAIVLGCGCVGSAALYELARRGVKVLGIEQYEPVHNLGSSYGQTRAIRQAYFEHPDYVPLMKRAYAQWAELAERTARQLYFETGLLQWGLPDGEIVPGALLSARLHDLDVEQFTAAEARRRFPTFRIRDEAEAVYEPHAGYLAVEACVAAHLEMAERSGARLLSNTPVSRWTSEDQQVRVVSSAGEFTCERLVITAGAWAGGLLSELGLPLVVRRKMQLWFHAEPEWQAAWSQAPVYLAELPEGFFYGFPALPAPPGGGAAAASRGPVCKIAEHSGGEIIESPAALDRQFHERDTHRIGGFAAANLAGVTHDIAWYSACMYTLSPDWHFYVDRYPRDPRVVYCAGLSGHGFKFAPVLGQAMADLALEGESQLPIRFLKPERPGQ